MSVTDPGLPTESEVAVETRKRRRDSRIIALPVRSDDTWMQDADTGELLPPLRVRRFMDWFLDPSRPAGTGLVDWARENDLNVNTVRQWLKDPRFRKVMDERCQELNLRPDRTQAVIEAMWKKAVNGNVAAAALYLNFSGKMAPQRVEHSVTVNVRKLTDEQLQAELAKLHALPAPVIDAEVVEG